jgi:hypothetical protein
MKRVFIMLLFAATVMSCTEEIVTPVEDPKHPCTNCSLPNPGKP